LKFTSKIKISGKKKNQLYNTGIAGKIQIELEMVPVLCSVHINIYRYQLLFTQGYRVSDFFEKLEPNPQKNGPALQHWNC
jgi:hypothetical protein